MLNRREATFNPLAGRKMPQYQYGPLQSNMINASKLKEKRSIWNALRSAVMVPRSLSVISSVLGVN